MRIYLFILMSVVCLCDLHSKLLRSTENTPCYSHSPRYIVKFSIGKFKITKLQEPILDSLLRFIQDVEHENLRMYLYNYAFPSEIKSDRLIGAKRALAIVDYFENRGIHRAKFVYIDTRREQFEFDYKNESTGISVKAGM
jgi:hypothetical protein